MESWIARRLASGSIEWLDVTVATKKRRIIIRQSITKQVPMNLIRVGRSLWIDADEDCRGQVVSHFLPLGTKGDATLFEAFQ